MAVSILLEDLLNPAQASNLCVVSRSPEQAHILYKMWPAPQGWDNEQQWPGPPDAVLDGGPYTAEIIKEQDQLPAVRLISKKDKRSGIQFSRLLKTFDGTTHVSIDATMTNIDTKPRRWGIWTVTPLRPLEFAKVWTLTPDEQVPASADKVALHLYNPKGQLLGELANAEIQR